MLSRAKLSDVDLRFIYIYIWSNFSLMQVTTVKMDIAFENKTKKTNKEAKKISW